MRVIALTGPRRVEVTCDWPEPRPGPDEIVVAVRAVGLCGSDLAVYDGTRAVPGLPWVLGHEGGGEVVAVGPDVTGHQVGRRVVIEPNYCCFACPACRSGATSACVRRRSVGITVPGLLAERVAVPARFAWPVPPTVPDAALACVEPLAVARSAVRRSRAGAGDVCLVVGAGSQGLFVCQALLAAGSRPHVTDPQESRLALAGRIGAEPVDPAGARDYPLVFDTVGLPGAWETSQRAVATGGVIVMIGMGSRPVPLSTMELTRRQMAVRGSLIYDHPADFADTVAAVNGSTGQVLQEGAPPERAAETFATARTTPGKSWIDLADWRKDCHAP